VTEPFTRTGEDTASSVKDDVQEPKQFKVVMHNDDYTTMDFVVRVLMQVFRKSQEQATQIMLRIHNTGKAVCGVYTEEVAETKVTMVKTMAKNEGYPLKCSMEEV
jgi:ATP-dependent Clp protease adaptor protein ClpS